MDDQGNTRDRGNSEGTMTQHEEDALDRKISEVQGEITRLETIRREVEALGRRGNKEQAFFAGRRSALYELRESGGLVSSRLGTEILFLLPDDFVQVYGALFHRALDTGDSSVMHGRSGGLEKAKGRTGMQLGSDDRGGQAGATGKRFKERRIPIGSEKMLRLKEGIDRELLRLTHAVKDAMAEAGGEADIGHQAPKETSQASVPHTKQCSNGSCRGFLKASWRHCPMCGTRTATLRDEGYAEGTLAD